ncbi:flavin reductase family protein [Labilibacter sediminis]|nr:flavin reductase family protein [Labilibacter sediminis]
MIPDSLKTKVSLGKKNLMFPKPAVVIGSYDKDGVPNIMTAAWTGVVNSHPLKMAVSMRPATLSYHNLTLNKAFTINVPSTEWVGVADYVGRYSGHDMQKFEKLGLTPLQGDSVYAPYIKEFPIAIECKITEIIDLGSHRQFIGEVLDTKVTKAFLKGKKNVDVEKLDPLILANGYYGLGNYVAKPGQALKMYED